MALMSFGSARSWREGDTIMCDGRYVTIIEVAIYQPFTHPHSPIRDGLTAIEAVTERGSRWAGVEVDSGAVLGTRALDGQLTELLECVAACERAERGISAMEGYCQ